MANRKDRTEEVKTMLALGVGESTTFPLEDYGPIRMLKYTNPQILQARSEGKEFSVSPSMAEKCVVVARTR